MGKAQVKLLYNEKRYKKSWYIYLRRRRSGGGAQGVAMAEFLKRKKMTQFKILKN